MGGLVGKTDKNSNVCLDEHWPSGVSFLQCEGASIVHSSCGKGWTWSHSGSGQLSLHLLLGFCRHPSAGHTLAADSPAAPTTWKRLPVPLSKREGPQCPRHTCR